MLVLGLTVPVLRAQCGARPRRVVDWALHRQWLVERDCAHPARPARLVEVPWSDAAARRAGREAVSARPNPGAKPAEGTRDVLSLPVRPGMKVLVVHRDRDAEMRLSGTALEGGAEGSVVLVRAGLRGAVLHTVVIGPARVRLADRRLP
jgi:hypothetical protein